MRDPNRHVRDRKPTIQIQTNRQLACRAVANCRLHFALLVGGVGVAVGLGQAPASVLEFAAREAELSNQVLELDSLQTNGIKLNGNRRPTMTGTSANIVLSLFLGTRRGCCPLELSVGLMELD